MATLVRPRGGVAEVQTSETSDQARDRLLWGLPALVTLAMSALGMGTPLLGTDELVTWDVSRRTLGQVWGMVHNVDAVHGTYYVLMQGWVAIFGESVVALRLPSAVAMSGAAAFVALIGARLFTRRAGLCSGLLFALIPVVSRFGQEARSYALVIMAVTLATYLLLRALDSAASWSRWAVYGLCVALIGLLNLIALTALAGHAVLMVCHAGRKWQALRPFLISISTGIACDIPVMMWGQFQAKRQLFWLPEPDGWALLGIWMQVFASACCAGVVITLAALALQRENRNAVALCATMALVPTIVLWGASHGSVSYFRYHYALVTVPAWAILAGSTLARLTRSWVQVASGLAALTLVLLPDHVRMRGTFEHDAAVSADYVTAAHVIMDHYQAGDGAVFIKGSPWMLDQGIRYYLPHGLKLRDVFFAKSAADNNELYPAYCAVPLRCLGSEKRIWLVVSGAPLDPLRSAPPGQAAALRAKYNPEYVRQVSGFTVVLLKRRGDSL